MDLLEKRTLRGAIERAFDSYNQYTWDDDVIESKAREQVNHFVRVLLVELGD